MRLSCAMYLSMCACVFQRIVGTKVFGVPLAGLVAQGEKTPAFLDRIIVLIETHGLYTEGIYRKSGSAAKIRALKMQLDTGVTGGAWS